MTLYIGTHCTLSQYADQVLHCLWKHFPAREGVLELNPHWFVGLSRRARAVLHRFVEIPPAPGLRFDGTEIRDPHAPNRSVSWRWGRDLETDPEVLSLLWDLEEDLAETAAALSGAPVSGLRRDLRTAIERGVKPHLCQTLLSPLSEVPAPVRARRIDLDEVPA